MYMYSLVKDRGKGEGRVELRYPGIKQKCIHFCIAGRPTLHLKYIVIRETISLQRVHAQCWGKCQITRLVRCTGTFVSPSAELFYTSFAKFNSPDRSKPCIHISKPWDTDISLYWTK